MSLGRFLESVSLIYPLLCFAFAAVLRVQMTSSRYSSVVASGFLLQIGLGLFLHRLPIVVVLMYESLLNLGYNVSPGTVAPYMKPAFYRGDLPNVWY